MEGRVSSPRLRASKKRWAQGDWWGLKVPGQAPLLEGYRTGPPVQAT